MNTNEAEIVVGPDGKVRAIYKDALKPVYEALGGAEVHRASNVEWEQGGWTVRSANDPEKAIRLQILNGAFRQVVSKEGEIAVFTTREAALESELRFFWDLVPQQESK